ncbi:Cdc37 N terminal kinase binding-domain-containing protein [Syncephalis fuscata]|nr:Cdc37 N terminal kinase binding-domain-containing protein [Syncephalis fuscata]
MSRLDYSKWDKLELSDDEDFECHPNVDKASFIRWRQEDIHQKRQERRDKIEALKAESTMNAALLKRLGQVVEKVQREETSVTKADDMNAWIEMYREQGKAPNAERQDNSPPYDDMIAALLMQLQVSKEVFGDKSDVLIKTRLLNELRVHKDKLNQRSSEVKKELEELEKEEASKLTMDNLCHDGFNKTIIKKSNQAKESTVEVLNPGYDTVNKEKTAETKRKSKRRKEEKEEEEEEEEEGDEQYIKTKEAREFAEIKGFEKSYAFMRANPWLSSAEISDEILSEAFTLQLADKPEKVEQYIRQAKILQYCSELGDGRYFEKFFQRLLGPDRRAIEVFEDDVVKTHAHIKERCIVLRKEQEERDAKRQQILDERDPNEPIDIAVPETATESDLARVTAFQSFPAPFQHALLSGDLERVNTVLKTLEEEEAERILQLCNATGMLSIEDGDGDGDDDDDEGEEGEEDDAENEDKPDGQSE